jgi:hypothetical protein
MSRLAVAGLAMLALVTGCERTPAAPPAEEENVRYGAAPRPEPGVTLQPDVVLVDGGSRAVRSVTADGLTWRLDPKAPHADRLTPGSVMFVTGRGVGRVLDVRRGGGVLAVTIGPVGLTEVIRDGTFSRPATGLDGPITYHAGQLFWANPESPRSSPRPTRSGVRPPAGAPPTPAQRAEQPPPTTGGRANVRAGRFNVTAVCCGNGVGARFGYDSAGLRLAGEVTLVLARPRVGFHLDISGASVREARLGIEGGAGLRVSLEAVTSAAGFTNLNQVLALPVDFSVPVGQLLGVPFTITVQQLLHIRTAFTAKSSRVAARGEYGFGGTLGFGYRAGGWRVDVPRGLTAQTKLTSTLSGLSVGVNGLVVAYQPRFYVGIGALGFTAGLWFRLTFSVGVTQGSAAVIPMPGAIPVVHCRSAQLTITADAGIGYSLPAVVADVVNLFLSTFSRTRIRKDGGIRLGRPLTVFNQYDVVPDVSSCR